MVTDYREKDKVTYHNPNSTFVTLYRLNTLKRIIGTTTPQVIIAKASGTNTYHKSESNGSFLHTALAKPSNVVWNR